LEVEFDVGSTNEKGVPNRALFVLDGIEEGAQALRGGLKRRANCKANCKEVPAKKLKSLAQKPSHSSS
jgi:hypothetical protein